MKVLHVITGLGVGGAELQLRAVLQQTRHDADVVTLYNPGPVADMIRADGNGVRSLGMQQQHPAVRAAPAAADHPGRAATTWCTPTCTARRSTAARPPGWRHAGRAEHRALDRRDAPGAQAR